MYRRGLATPALRKELRAQVHQAIARDATLVRQSTPTLIDMRAAAGVVVPDTRTKLRQLSEQTELASEREQRTEAAERSAQSDRKARLAAEAEIAHLKHLLDAANSAQHSR